MPIYEITTPDGKTLEVTAPDGATQEQVLAYAQSNYKPQPQQKQATTKPPMQDYAAQAARQVYDELPGWQKPIVSMGAEFTRLGRGIGQLVTPNDSAIHKRLTAAADADAPYQDGPHGAANFVGRAIPYLATIPLGGPEAAALRQLPNAGKLASLMIKGGVAAGEGAAYGGAGEVRTGESRGENAAFGAALGPLARMVAGGVAKAGHVVKGRWVDPEMQRINAYLTKQDIPVTLGDLGSNTSRFIENRLKPLFGSGRNEVLQQQARGVDAEAQKLAGGFTQQRMQAATQAGIADASPEQLVADGIGRQYRGNKATATGMFNEVSQASRGTQPANAANVQGSIAKIESEAPEALRGFTTSTQTILDKIKGGGAADLTFDQLRAMRSEIGQAARAAGRSVTMGNASKAVQNESRFLTELGASIDNDLEALAQSNGGDALAKYRAANNYFRENVAPYRSQPETKPFIRPDANPDNIGNKLMPNKPETARRIMAATDPTGRAAAKELVVNRSLDRATSPAADTASALSLTRQLNTGRAGAEIFSQQELAAIDKVGGIAKLLQRSSQASADPLTGQMNLAAIMQGGLGATAGAYAGSDNKTVAGIAGLAAALAVPRAVNSATKSAILKHLMFSGIPKNVAETMTEKLIARAAQRAPLGGQIGQHQSEGLNIDIVGGKLATPAQELAMRQGRF